MVLLLALPNISCMASATEQALSPTGLGRTVLGMTLNQIWEANSKSDFFESAGKAGKSNCYRMSTKVIDLMYNIDFVGFQRPTVDRIDVEGVDEEGYGNLSFLANRVRTKEGIGIGDLVSHMKHVYSRDNRYLPARFLNANYVVIAQKGKQRVGYAFVTDGETVTGMRAGRLDALLRQERCE